MKLNEWPIKIYIADGPDSFNKYVAHFHLEDKPQRTVMLRDLDQLSSIIKEIINETTQDSDIRH